jgi:hypothetical protein
VAVKAADKQVLQLLILTANLVDQAAGLVLIAILIILVQPQAVLALMG